MFQLSKLSFKGILLGIVFYCLASLLLGFSIVLTYSLVVGVADVKAAVGSSVGLQLASLMGGLVIMFFMGSVSEWFSPKHTLINAAICGVLLLANSIYQFFYMPEVAPAWHAIINIMVVIPMSIAGGWFISRAKKTVQSDLDSSAQVLSDETQLVPLKVITGFNIALSLIYGIGAYLVVAPFGVLFDSFGDGLPSVTRVVMGSYPYWIVIALLPIGIYFKYLTNDGLSKAVHVRLLYCSIAILTLLILFLPFLVIALYLPVFELG